MQRVALAVWVLWAGSVAIGGAQGPTPEVDDGNALLRECTTALRAADDDARDDAPPETDGGDPDDARRDDDVTRGFQMGQCLGLVSGVWHTHMMMVDEFDGQAAFCPSATISAGQMARLVNDYLQTHPAQLSEWDTVLIMRAFIDTYPCRR